MKEEEIEVTEDRTRRFYVTTKTKGAYTAYVTGADIKVTYLYFWGEVPKDIQAAVREAVLKHIEEEVKQKDERKNI